MHKNIPGFRVLAVCMGFYLTPDVKGLICYYHRNLLLMAFSSFWIKSWHKSLIGYDIWYANLVSVIFLLAIEYKHEFLKQYKDKTLSDMIMVLLEQFLPDIYNRYYMYLKVINFGAPLNLVQFIFGPFLLAQLLDLCNLQNWK